MSDIEEAINGNSEAFERIMIQNKEAMYKTAIVILRNEDDAYDALQEALIKIYQNISNLKSEEAFKFWSRRIVINCCYDLIKKSQKVVAITNKLTDIFEETREDFYECEDDLLKILNQIDRSLRLTVTLYYVDEMSVKEIAEMLEIPAGTVKSRLSRAREKLCEILKKEGSEFKDE